MSHLHLVDGVLSPLWWGTALVLTLMILGFATSRVKKEEIAKRVPYIGVVAALMLITMSVPLGFLPFHLNLTVLAGILAGPWLGFIAVFIVNLILAFIGHGGITVIGVNTLIIGSEVILGYYLFSLLKTKIKPTVAVVMTVIITLLVSTSLMMGVISMSEAGLVSALPHNEEHEAVEVAGSEIHAEEESHEEGLAEVLSELEILSLSGWSAVIAILLLGITLEALATALVIGYFLKVRADLILSNITSETDDVSLLE